MSSTYTEALVARFAEAKHTVLSMAGGALVIPKVAFRRCFIVGMTFQSDSASPMAIAISAPSTETRNLRALAGGTEQPYVIPGDPVFAAALDQDVTFTPTGYTAGTYAELNVVYYHA